MAIQMFLLAAPVMRRPPPRPRDLTRFDWTIGAAGGPVAASPGRWVAGGPEPQAAHGVARCGAQPREALQADLQLLRLGELLEDLPRGGRWAPSVCVCVYTPTARSAEERRSGARSAAPAASERRAAPEHASGAQSLARAAPPAAPERRAERSARAERARATPERSRRVRRGSPAEAPPGGSPGSWRVGPMLATRPELGPLKVSLSRPQTRSSGDAPQHGSAQRPGILAVSRWFRSARTPTVEVRSLRAG